MIDRQLVPPRHGQERAAQDSEGVTTGARVIFEKCASGSQSPYRLMDGCEELHWANTFLDAQMIRGLSPNSLRAYAYALLNLARWFCSVSLPLADLSQILLHDYIKFQLNSLPRPAPQTINHRLCVANCLYHFHLGTDIPANAGGPGPGLASPSPFARIRTNRAFRRLRVKAPRRVIMPLTAGEVSRFWNSFGSFRDLSLVALMLFSGLRSREVLLLKLEDLRPGQSQILVTGKGNRQRLLPLAPETIRMIENYLGLERPPTSSPFLFLTLKGPNRGSPLSPAGLRSLFRHHRRASTVLNANPHRFRHTFGADMVRAGISLPALMHLMGHRQIHTTMLYVQISPSDVWREFHLATSNMRLPQASDAP